MVRISNKKLLELMLKNARMSFVDMAKKLGVTEAAVRKRVRKLEANGSIRGYTIIVDPKSIGYNIDALIGIDTTPEKLLAVIRKLKRRGDVLSLYTSSGDHMIMIECWFKTHDELDKFVKMLERMDGVTRVCPATILEKLK